MKEVVFSLGRISTDGDGDKHCSVNGDQWEQQGVVCNWRGNELGGAEAEEQNVGKYPAERVEDMNSGTGVWTEEQQAQRLALWAGHQPQSRRQKKGVIKSQC